MVVPETSIIIRTFNEEKHVKKLFDSLRSQNYNDFEIILVDSGSLDRTRDIADQYVDKMIRINSRDFTFGYSLNVGIKESQGIFSVIVSAHTIPTSDNWLGKLISPLRDNSIAMSYGRQIGCPTSKFSEVSDLLRTFGTKKKIHKPPNYFAHNGNSAIRRQLWEEHPFDECLTGLEDIEWARYWMDAGYYVVYEPEAGIHHIHEEQWNQIENRYYREALALRSMNRRLRRHIPVEIAKEFGNALLDVGVAIRPNRNEYTDLGGNFLSRSREIFHFRWRKGKGTFRGLVEGAAIQAPNFRESVFFERTTRHIVMSEPGRMTIVDKPIPQTKPGDVIIRVAYNGICGKDLALFDGAITHYKGESISYPIILGHEVSGYVVKTGANISHVKEGDRVVLESIKGCGRCADCQKTNLITCSERIELGMSGLYGGCSQYLNAPGSLVHKLPDGFRLDLASLSEPLSVVLKGVNRLPINRYSGPGGQKCAVVGAGSMGHLCSKVLRYMGHQVKAFDQDVNRRSYLADSGIAVSDKLSELETYDIIIDATGSPDVLAQIFEISPVGATILLLGLPHSYSGFTFEGIVNYDKTIVGSVGSGPLEFQQAIDLLPLLDVEELLQCILPMSEVAKGFDIFKNRQYLKVILQMEQ